MKMRKHASIRIYERCSLNNYEIASKLKNDKYYPIGMEGNRQHRLIYSEPDCEFFVLVYDIKTDEAITILPLDYHNRWKLSESVLEVAKQHLGLSEKPKEKNIPDTSFSLGIIANVNFMTINSLGVEVIAKSHSFKLGTIYVPELKRMGLTNECKYNYKDVKSLFYSKNKFVSNVKKWAEYHLDDYEVAYEGKKLVSLTISVKGENFKPKAMELIEIK